MHACCRGGGAKEAVSCLSNRTTKPATPLEPIPHSPRTLDHTSGGRAGDRGVPLGKTKGGRGGGGLLDDAWSTEPRRRGKMHTHHHEASHRCRYNNKGAMWQTCTYVWVAVVVLSVVPHTRLGQGRQERARLVGSTRVHKIWLRHRRLTCRLAPCTYTHRIFDAGLLDNKHNAVSSMSLWWLSSGVQSFC